jgi:putative hydrolase of the HAD superfamily
MSLRRRAVLLDALGTLLELEDPAPGLARELATRHGLVVSVADARRALAAEMAFYRAHHDEGCDRERLAGLRRRCAAVLREGLPGAARALSLDEALAALMATLRFRPYPEVRAALATLREHGATLVAVSNWDVSLHEVLDRTRLADLLDGAVSSAEVGSAKPDREIFARALALAGASAREAIHVGDSPEHDVAGALGAGIEPVLVVRDGSAAPQPSTRPFGQARAGAAQVKVIHSLADLPAVVAT